MGQLASSFIHGTLGGAHALPVLVRGRFLGPMARLRETIHPFLDGKGRLGRLADRVGLLIDAEVLQACHFLYLSLFSSSTAAATTTYSIRRGARTADWRACDRFLPGGASRARRQPL